MEDYIKSLQRELKKEGVKRTIKSLLALDPNNDPFYAECHEEDAKWFALAWQNRGNRVHLRGLHYKLSAEGTTRKPNGEIYRNTYNDWKYLSLASKYARYLGLIDQAIEDHKHPKISRYITTENHERSFDANPYVMGYKADIKDEVYYVELWVEKSGLNPVLVPICRELRVNLQVLEGTGSLVRVDDSLERINRYEKPARIFYLSDLDPVGSGMAAEVARKIEFLGEGTDIKLDLLAVIGEQIEEYNLQRAPIKTARGTDRGIKQYEGRKKAFEKRHGEGEVELDALNPDDLEKIVRDALEPYRDLDYLGKIKEAEEEAEAQVEELFAEYEEQLEEIYNDIRERIDWPERPECFIGEEPDRDWLYDSERDYLSQLDAYKRQKNEE